MKTTDSVKDKFIKWLAEESGEPEHLVMLMQSVYVNPESMFKFFSHSLAEARREERERIKRVFYPMNKEDLLPIGKAIDEWVKLHEELGGEVVWQSMGDSEYDRPRPIRAIYHTPLKIFHGMMGIGDDLLTGDNPERKE